MQKPSGFSTRAVLAVGLISLQYMNPQPSHAACVLTPGTGNDTYMCNNGSSAGLTDLSGDNSLTLSTGGAINGDVTFGPGIDTVEIRDGRVTGIVQQGDGVDRVVMMGGRIGGLFQGDGRDVLEMYDGIIDEAFEDGDVAYQRGGKIGRVNMKLDKNFYEMTGGKSGRTWSPVSTPTPSSFPAAPSAAISAPAAAMTASPSAAA